MSVQRELKTHYIGRFAPSPTGVLHYGSLLAAVASYLQAKRNDGQWLIRIEDIDPPREAAGAADDILHTLERYQFEWDQTPLYQSTRFGAYRDSINTLKEKELVYACACSRKHLEKNAKESILGKKYPGICRSKRLEISNPNSNLRLRTTDDAICFTDHVFGEQTQTLFSNIGDFIIQRKMDLPTFALAVTIDDAFQGITEVVRGHDLLAFTPLQIYLCRILELPIPEFLHIPIITDQQGCKLSKQSFAKALPSKNCSSVLTQALKDLGQTVPNNLTEEKLEDIWKWAVQHWDVMNIPQSQGIPITLN